MVLQRLKCTYLIVLLEESQFGTVAIEAVKAKVDFLGDLLALGRRRGGARGVGVHFHERFCNQRTMMCAQ